MVSTLDHCKKSPLVVVPILLTLCEFTAWMKILGNGICNLLENSLWCIKCTLTVQWQQWLLPSLAVSLKFTLKHLAAGTLINSGKWHQLLTTGKNPLLLWYPYYGLFVNLLYAWIFWEIASALCWKIHCGV